MKSWILASLALSGVFALDPNHQYQVDPLLSFGQSDPLSHDHTTIPHWRSFGEPHVLSDRVTLTPPWPGSKRSALWAESRNEHKEWLVDIAFRVTGPEHGGGNLQLWYTKDGGYVTGTDSVFNTDKFDGLAIVVDSSAGGVGKVRGFLNAGTTSFSNHHNLDSLAFAHCDFVYRNLGKPSLLTVSYTHQELEVQVDHHTCFKTSHVKLPAEYHFGLSAASAPEPDSFEVMSFITHATNVHVEPAHHEESHKEQHHGEMKADHHYEKADAAASGFHGEQEQFVDIHDRVQALGHQVSSLQDELVNFAEELWKRTEILHPEKGYMDEMERRLINIERVVSQIQKDVETGEMKGHLTNLHQALTDTHESLFAYLPEHMAHIVHSNKPQVGFLVFVVICFQLVFAGSYVAYKRRKSQMKAGKYL